MELYLSRIILNPLSKAVMHDLGNQRELHKTISRCFPEIEGQADRPQHERATPRNTYKTLHRLDRKGDCLVLYIQSNRMPDWKALPRDYGRVDTRPVHDLYGHIKKGTRLHFRLAANPTRRVSRSDEMSDPRFRSSMAPAEYRRRHGKNETRRRVEILGDREPDANGIKKSREEKLVEWLQRKGEITEQIIESPGRRDRGETVRVGGFKILSVNVDDRIANVAIAVHGKATFKREKGDKHSVTLDAVTFEGVLEVTDADAFRSVLANGIGPGKAYGFGLMSIAPVN